MPKYYQGISFEKHAVTHGEETREVVIAMTEDEQKDESYVEYLTESAKEIMHKQMADKPHKTPDPEKRKALGLLLKERQEFDARKKSEHPKRYF